MMDPEVIRSQAAAQGWWSRARAEVIRSLLPSTNGSVRIVDVGAGWGEVSSALSGLGDVIAVDPSPAARSEGEKRGVRVIAGRAEELPIEDESIDIAVACDVIEHLPDDAIALRELARVLCPGGVALVTVPAYPWLMGAHDRAVGHERRYTRGMLVDRIERAGFEVRRATYFNALLFPLALPRRLMNRSREARAEDLRAPGPLDAVFYRTFRSERALLSRFNLPFGLSVAVLATRPPRSARGG